MTTVVKLGGSVITDKDSPETVDRDTLDRAATALSKSDDRLIVVHGAGSFGHHHASKHGVSTTDGTHDDEAIRAIHGSMKRLNDTVVDALVEAGLPAVPVHPLSAASRSADGELSFPAVSVEAMLEEEFVPVLHGDIIAHERSGATILSGDEIVVSLATTLDADHIGLCSAVRGVYDEDGAVIDRIERFEDVAGAVGGSDATDVTGGMAGKVHALLALDAPAHVFDIDGLEAFVAGGTPGTEIE